MIGQSEPSMVAAVATDSNLVAAVPGAIHCRMRKVRPSPPSSSKARRGPFAQQFPVSP